MREFVHVAHLGDDPLRVRKHEATTVAGAFGPDSGQLIQVRTSTKFRASTRERLSFRDGSSMLVLCPEGALGFSSRAFRHPTEREAANKLVVTPRGELH